MSLVVCKNINGRIFIESDTRITDINEAKKESVYGLVKAVILYPQLCISFAGNIYLAEEAIKELLAVKNLKLNVILETLVKYSSNPENSVEFILCTIKNNRCRIFKISHSEVEFDLPTAWIGDSFGFNLFQKHYHQLKNSGKSEEVSLNEGFKEVIGNEKIETVGDFQIGIVTDTQINPTDWVFQYRPSFIVTLGRSRTLLSSVQDTSEHVINWGTAEEGSYGISYFISVTPQFQAIAIYFSQGNFGVLFCPKINFEAIVKRDKSGPEFLEILKEEYKIPMQGTLLIDNTTLQIIDMRVMKRDGNTLIKI